MIFKNYPGLVSLAQTTSELQHPLNNETLSCPRTCVSESSLALRLDENSTYKTLNNTFEVCIKCGTR